MTALTAEIRALEERLLQPEVRRSRAALDRLLADDFVELASDGNAYDKAAVIAALEKERTFRRVIGGFRVAAIADGVVLATYEAVREDPGSGQTVESLRSSLWRREGRGWRLVFHQGTVRRPR
jgi:hypothetical protein